MQNIIQIFKNIFGAIKVNWKSALIALLFVWLGYGALCLSLIPFFGLPFIFLTPFFIAALGMALTATRGDKVKFGDIIKPIKVKGFYWQAILLHVLMVLTAPLCLIGVGLRWFLAPIVLAENPEMTAIEAMKKSAELMKGHKLELYLTLLAYCLISFIIIFGWLLMCFTIGLLFIGVPFVKGIVTTILTTTINYTIILFAAKYYDYVKAGQQ